MIIDPLPSLYLSYSEVWQEHVQLLSCEAGMYPTCITLQYLYGLVIGQSIVGDPLAMEGLLTLFLWIMNYLF